jgi:hypothetical protein
LIPGEFGWAFDNVCTSRLSDRQNIRVVGRDNDSIKTSCLESCLHRTGDKGLPTHARDVLARYALRASSRRDYSDGPIRTWHAFSQLISSFRPSFAGPGQQVSSPLTVGRLIYELCSFEEMFCARATRAK